MFTKKILKRGRGRLRKTKRPTWKDRREINHSKDRAPHGKTEERQARIQDFSQGRARFLRNKTFFRN